MADRDSADGPMLVWTFPAITRIQNGNGILGLGAGALSVSQKVSDVKETGPVREKLTDSDDEDSGSDDEEITDLESQIESVGEDSESIFSQSEDDEDDNDYGQAILEDNIIEIQEGTFVPIRLEVEPGDTVGWVNEDDSTHRVVSSSGDDFSSEQLEPGDEFEHTFRDEGVTKFFDSIEGQQNICGAVIVGDAELEEDLPCERDVERQLFSDETDGSRTMSAAAEEKEDMDRGF